MSGEPATDGRGDRTAAPRRAGRPGWARDSFLQAGFLAGAVVGATVTVLGRRAEQSARRGLIDWKAAERLAARRLRNAPGSLDPVELRRAAPIYAAAMAEIVPALSRAVDAELPGVVERSGVVDRATWVHANVATFAALMGKVEGDLLDQVLPPGSGLVKATMAIALPDADAEIDPVPTSGGGQLSEVEMYKLSNIIKAFNDQFGGLFR